MSTRSAFAVLFAVITITVIGLWYVGNRAIGQRAPATATSTLALTRTNQPDTDGDGLRDWEEELWGTQKNNPDTDGDGVSDGEEIVRGTDHRVPGPTPLTSDIDKSRALVHKLNYSRTTPILSPDPTDLGTGSIVTLSSLNTVNTTDLNLLRQYGLSVAETLAPLG